MGLYEQIREAAKTRGYSINRLEQELGFARSSINKFNKNAPSVDKLLKIAETLGVTIDYLMTGTEENNICSPCPDRGLWYDPNDVEEIEFHVQQHAAWEKATDMFGKLYCNSVENEKIKAENRNISHNASLPLNERFNAQIKVLRCLFSRSVEANHFDLNHVPFKTYVAMMLDNESYRKYSLEDDLLSALYKTYGTMPGISNGTIYHVPETKITTITKQDKKDDKRIDQLTSAYMLLNSFNKDKVVKYSENLLNIQQAEEEQKHLIPNAAHERIDIEMTEKAEKHGDAFFDE